MPDQKIPFEIHITIEALHADRQPEFVDFCFSQGAKPLMIELAKGEFASQPMLSKTIYAETFEDILAEANGFSMALQNDRFEVKRLKIEVPAENAPLFTGLETAFVKYYEWHGKVNYRNAAALLKLCEAHQVHLSLNALKTEGNFRFITLREFGNQTKFENRISHLKTALTEGKWTLGKMQSEYCIYDNNNFLDKGWLPQ